MKCNNLAKNGVPKVIWSQKTRFDQFGENRFFTDFWLFFNFGPRKMAKNQKLAKFPNNVWKTHKMEQLGQKWGSKSYLEQKR